MPRMFACGRGPDSGRFTGAHRFQPRSPLCFSFKPGLRATHDDAASRCSEVGLIAPHDDTRRWMSR